MATADGLLDVFVAALEGAAGRFVRVPDLARAREAATALARGGTVAWADAEPDETELRAAAVGADVADLLIAETGTVVRTFASRREARASLVPPVSAFVATPDALVPTLPDALARLEPTHAAGRTTTVLLTGPSRTADIEKQLVIPAHGPRELVVIWIEGTPDA